MQINLQSNYNKKYAIGQKEFVINLNCFKLYYHIYIKQLLKFTVTTNYKHK